MNQNKKNQHVYPLGRQNNYLFLGLIAFLFLFPSYVFADEVKKVTLSHEHVTLPVILKDIKAQTDYDFMYNAKEIDADKKITVQLKNVSLDSALQVCLRPFGLTYQMQGRIIVLRKAQQTSKTIAQSVINGLVKDENGVHLPGVAILLEGTTMGTATDMDGRFKLTIPAGKHRLTFTFIGMKPVYKEVNGDADITVVMEEDAAELEEVVVTGMETIKKDYMTGSASVITAKDLRTQGITSIDRVLEGTIAGLNSTTVSGAPGTRAQITIRGENNLSGNTEPLWIVDGLPLLSGVPENNTGDYAGTIMQDGVGNIMPEDIESISILKDASAAAIYGAKAANGVIVITTKKGFRSKTQFNYSGNYSISTAPRLHVDFMNSREKL